MRLKIDRIDGTRIYLRSLGEDDASPEYLSWLNDPEIKKYLETPPTNSTEQLKEYIRKQNEDPNSIFLGIFDRKKNRHIGNIKLEPIDWQKKIARFGTLIGNKDYWNNGYGTEASQLILKYAFEEIGLEKVDLGVIEYNQRAINCYKKCGFKIREIVPKCLNHEGIIYDNVMMEISKEEFEENRILSKLALGTVQFGKDYGISNKRGKIPQEEALKILESANQNGISTLDSAYNYGDAEEVIGEFIASNKNARFKIVSKLPKDSLNLQESVEVSLRRMNIERFYGYLFHDFKSFLDRPELLEEIRSLKKSGTIEKIGFSLYYPQELEYLFNNNVEFDLIQFPFSILDQRFLKYLPELKRRGIEIHVRSVFLQGLVFKDPKELEEFFVPIKEKLQNLNSISQELKTPISAICLNFVLLNDDIDKVIIGLESYENLQENIDSIKFRETVKTTYPRLLELNEINEKIILPTNWPKKK